MEDRKQLFLSFDVEATGSAPGLNSMLSIGVVAYDSDTRMAVDSFEANMRELDGSVWDPQTWTWWTDPERETALSMTTRSQVDPQTAMEDMLGFLERLRLAYPEHDHVYVAYPATFDMPFLTYYMLRFCYLRWVQLYGSDVMQRLACLDIGSYVMAATGLRYHEVSRKRMPAEWFEGIENPHPHVAVHDAREQGDLFMRIFGSVQQRRSERHRLRKERLLQLAEEWEYRANGKGPDVGEVVEQLVRELREVVGHR